MSIESRFSGGKKVDKQEKSKRTFTRDEMTLRENHKIPKTESLSDILKDQDVEYMNNQIFENPDIDHEDNELYNPKNAFHYYFKESPDSSFYTSYSGEKHASFAALHDIPGEFWNENIFIEALQVNGYNIFYLPSDLLTEHYILTALSYFDNSSVTLPNHENFRKFLNKILEANPEQISEAVIKKLTTIYDSNDVESKELLISEFPNLLVNYFLDRSKYNFEYIPEEFQRKPEIYKPVIIAHPEMYSELPKDLQIFENALISSTKFVQNVLDIEANPHIELDTIDTNELSNWIKNVSPELVEKIVMQKKEMLVNLLLLENFETFLPNHYNFESAYIYTIKIVPDLIINIPMKDRTLKICETALRLKPLIYVLLEVPKQVITKDMIISVLNTNNLDIEYSLSNQYKLYLEELINHIPENLLENTDVSKALLDHNIVNKFPSFQKIQNFDESFLNYDRADLSQILEKMIVHFNQVLTSIGKTKVDIKERLKILSEKLDSSRIGPLLVRYALEIEEIYPRNFVVQSLDIIVEMVNELPKSKEGSVELNVTYKN